MLGRICRKIVEILITLFCSTLIIFLLVHLAPGDPVEALYGRVAEVAMGDNKLYESKIEEMRTELGLNESFAVQYTTWLSHLARFDLGTSIRTSRPVANEIMQRLPATILLAVSALVIQVVLGFIFGIISALRAGKTPDNVIRLVCVFFASVPGFVIGLGLLSLFAVTLSLYKIGGVVSLGQLWLPSLTLALGLSPQFIRVVRASLLSQFGQTYILSAKSRGLSKSLLVKHAISNSALPITTMLAISFTSLLGGSVVVESIFAWPGISKYAMDSIMVHDYPVIQGYAFVIVSLVILVNLFVEVLYAVVDPRVRNSRRKQVNEKA